MLLNLLLTFCLSATIALTLAETPEVLTQDVINVLLKGHNDARAAVSLPPLVWNETLSEYASNWTSQCILKHSQGPYGENNAYTSSRDNLMAAQSSIQMWSSEIANIDIPTWNCFGINYKPTCGHYSQMVWGKTKSIGCSMTHCESLQPFRNFVMCEYFPRGNYLGQKPY
ncbi:hypothetical protein Btru_065463 [Bulinus truncatus]|nr:hypothetical protein Btru_065463 [Bulinus truncatus]